MELLGNISLHLGDCMDVLKELPDNSFDLAIVDPSYFSGPERRQFYGCRNSAIGVKRLYAKSEKWNVPTAEYFDELKRVAKYYIVWGCNYFDYIFDHGRIVWDKCNGASSFSDCEIAATNLFQSVRLFPFMWNGMCQGKSITEGRIMQGNKKLNEKRIHPTQKPVAFFLPEEDEEFGCHSFPAEQTHGWNNKMFVRAELMPHQIRITNVSVERLQDISDPDIKAEGVDYVNGYSESYFFGFGVKTDKGWIKHGNTLREAYAALIDRISGKDTWESNPYVFVYDFELI